MLVAAKLDGVKTYMRMRRVPSHLQVKVIKWFDYLWLTQKCSDEEKAVSCLPGGSEFHVQRTDSQCRRPPRAVAQFSGSRENMRETIITTTTIERPVSIDGTRNATCMEIN